MVTSIWGAFSVSGVVGVVTPDDAGVVVPVEAGSVTPLAGVVPATAPPAILLLPSAILLSAQASSSATLRTSHFLSL